MAVPPKEEPSCFKSSSCKTVVLALIFLAGVATGEAFLATDLAARLTSAKHAHDESSSVLFAAEVSGLALGAAAMLAALGVCAAHVWRRAREPEPLPPLDQVQGWRENIIY